VSRNGVHFASGAEKRNLLENSAKIGDSERMWDSDGERHFGDRHAMRQGKKTEKNRSTRGNRKR